MSPGDKMKSYDVFLFDADGTLFNFNMAEACAFKTVYEECGFAYSDDILKRYSEINEQLWKSFEKAEVTIDEIKTLRFIRLFNEMGVHYDEYDFNDRYVVELGKGAFLIDGAKEICEEITRQGKKIYIITNGITKVQIARLGYSTIKEFVSDIFISELIGFQKPDVRYFEHVFSNMPQVDKERILVVGDSLTADIKGGVNAGLDTCWFNEKTAENSTDITPTYTIYNLSELTQFI